MSFHADEVARLDALWDNVEKLVSGLKATGISVPTLALDPLIVAAGDEEALSRHAAAMGR